MLDNWYFTRARLMSWPELLFYRPKQLFKKYFLDRCFSRKRIFPNEISVNSEYKSNYYSHKTIQNIAIQNENLKKYTIFNQVTVNLNKDLSWRKDYKNGVNTPYIFYADINRQNFAIIGDIKYVAELSRLHFLPFLAIEQVSSNKLNSPFLIEKHLAGWVEQNPFLKSIHWTSGIEIAIRSINILYTHNLLNHFGKLTDDTDLIIKKLILYSYNYIKNHLSKYSSANNHLIAELAGLVCISSYFRSEVLDKEQKKWRELLYKELNKQTKEDGVNTELSTRYHAEVLDHFLNSFLFIERSGNNVPLKYKNKLGKMFDFVHHSVGYEKCVMEFSDSDDGYLIYPYFDKDFNLYKSLLGSAYIYLNKKYSNTPTEIDFRNYLIFGDTSEKLKQIPSKKNTIFKDKIFKQSGYCFFYDNNKRAKVGFDLGEIGDKISAAHGHSDLLHFIFEVSGFQYLVDSGTFQYHSNYKRWRSYFRGISSHNTISIEGEDHAKQNNRMSWINRPGIKLLSYKGDKEKGICSAKHDAFKEKFGVVHKRTLILYKSEHVLLIRDHLFNSSDKDRKGEFYLHFHPDIKDIQTDKNTIKLKKTDYQEIALKNKYFNNARIFKGNREIPLGWYSKSYDKIQPTATLVLPFQIKSKDGIQINTEIRYQNG